MPLDVPPVTPSEIHHLLLTNDEPLDVEYDIVRGILATAEPALSDLDTEIARLEAALECAHRQRRELQKFIHEHKAILTPFRRLPPEIIAKIILHVYHYQDWPRAAVTLDTSRGLWIFTRISRVWRDVALSFPKLWSYLRLDTARPSDRRLEILKVVLGHSQDLPLSFAFWDYYPHISPKRLDILIRESHRWEDVKISIFFPGSITQLNALKGNLPCLRQLHLSIRIFSIADVRSEDVPPLDGFEVAPLLRSLIIDRDIDVNLSLPWTQLTDFNERYTHRPLSQLSKINLTTGTGVDSSGSAAQSNSNTPILLPRLRIINAQNTSALDFVTVPALEHLHIDVKHFGSSITSVSSLFRRSQCALKSLMVGEMDGSSLVDMLRLVPTLTSLRVWGASYDRTLISALTAMKTSNTLLLLPNLTALEMVVSTEMRDGDGDDADFDNEAFMRMVESRWWSHGSCLKKFFFSVYFGDDSTERISSQTVMRCEELRRDGLELVIEARLEESSASLGDAIFKRAA